MVETNRPSTIIAILVLFTPLSRRTTTVEHKVAYLIVTSLV